MAIINRAFNQTGQIGQHPRRIKMVVTDSLAQITAAGYLNPENLLPDVVYATDIFDIIYSYNRATKTGTYAEFLPTITAGVITLALQVSSGDVLLPVVTHHIASFNGTTGQIADGAWTAIQKGSLQAGLSGTAGTFISFPATAANGSLIVAAVNNAAGFNTTLSNAASVGQAQVLSLPDSGAAAANVIISKSAADQHITVSGLQADAGPLISGISTGGFVGLLKAFPTTASKGFIALQAAVNATGNFGTTITNGLAIAQSQTLTIPDVGGAAGFLNGQTISANLTPGSVIITKDISLTAAGLATAGKINIQSALATAQFKIRDIKVNYSASGLSGGGGDRLVVVTDGTTVYNNAGITAALLGTPINTVWAGTGNPLAGTVALNTSSVAGAQIYAQYSGGTADYASGTVVITVTYERVA